MSHFTEPFPLSQARISRAGDVGVAFREASNALSPPRVSAKPLTTTHSGHNGEIVAATSAGMGKQRSARTPNEERVAYEDTESFRAQRPTVKKPSPSQRVSTISQEGEEPKHSNRTQEQLPSSIAALTSDTALPPANDVNVPSESALRKPFISQKPRTVYSSNKEHTDESPILATTTLVKLFESQSRRSSPPRNKAVSRTSKPALQNLSSNATVPFVNGGVLTSTEHPETSIINNNLSRSYLQERPFDSLSNAWVLMASRVADPVAAQPERSKPTISITGPAPKPTLPRRTRQDSVLETQKKDRPSSSTNDLDGNSSASSYASATDKFAVRVADSSDKSRSFVANNPLSSRPKRPSEPVSRGSNKDGSIVVGGRPSRDGLLLPRNLAPQLTADSLANAMVASSLASSRAPSPSKPPLPPPRRNGKQHSLFRRSQSQDQIESRTPSPGRSMRQTMRKSPKPDDEEEYRKKGGFLLKKHPNKHHEGDRKRWRDEITEQERKRYEGVWAANKGLCMSSGDVDSAGTVLSLVVRDIWRRSRLPDDVLEEVWNLVDIEKVGRLRKEEFVVGLWLIDQRLKGRKLPTKVSESVWFSARALSGIKVSKSHR